MLNKQETQSLLSAKVDGMSISSGAAAFYMQTDSPDLSANTTHAIGHMTMSESYGNLGNGHTAGGNSNLSLWDYYQTY